MSRAKPAFALVLLAALSGCAGSSRRLAEADRVRLDVPFYSDDFGRCGPAGLASILTYWERPTEPAQLRRDSGPQRLKGTLPVGLMLAAQERGMQARSFQARLQDVKNELKLAHPVLAYVELGRWLSRGRFVVVTGFDDGRGGLFVHGGRYANRFVEYRAFMAGWEKTGRWAVLVLPAGERSVGDTARLP